MGGASKLNVCREAGGFYHVRYMCVNISFSAFVFAQYVYTTQVKLYFHSQRITKKKKERKKRIKVKQFQDGHPIIIGFYQ